VDVKLADYLALAVG